MFCTANLNKVSDFIQENILFISEITGINFNVQIRTTEMLFSEFSLNFFLQ